MIKFKNKNNEKVVAVMDDADEEPQFTEQRIKELVKESEEDTDEPK